MQLPRLLQGSLGFLGGSLGVLIHQKLVFISPYGAL